MSIQWEITSPHWTKVVDVADDEDLTQQVVDLVNCDEWPECTDEHNRFWVWVMCQQVGTDEWISLDVFVSPRGAA